LVYRCITDFHVNLSITYLYLILGVRRYQSTWASNYLGLGLDLKGWGAPSAITGIPVTGILHWRMLYLPLSRYDITAPSLLTLVVRVRERIVNTYLSALWNQSALFTYCETCPVLMPIALR
jgi:hypothetical protein